MDYPVKSHPDEIDELLGNADQSYIESVQRHWHERNAGIRLANQLRYILTYYTANIVVARAEMALAEFEHTSRGYSWRNAASGTCDCNDYRVTTLYQGRCTGCGASVYTDEAVGRRELDPEWRR